MVRISKITTAMFSGKKRRLFFGIAALVIMAGLMILYSRSVERTPIAPSSNNEYAKATVTAILEDYTGAEEGGGAYTGSQLVEVEITSGTYKGRTCEASNSNSYLTGAYCEEGSKVVVLVGENNGELAASVYNYDRGAGIWALVGVFFLALCLIGGKKGISASAALIFTFICIVFLYVPMMYAGVSPFWAAVIVSMLILVVSILLLDGWSAQAFCAILGTAIGVLIAGATAALFGTLCHITGFNMSDAETMIHIGDNSGLQVGGILFSGILIASLGAVMDQSVSVAAAIQEIKRNNPEFGWKRLYQSGIRVGHDMMGTMSNTLILAFVGSSVNTLIIVYAYEMPYLQIMSQYAIAIEILRGLSGTLGVILTVPVESAIAAFWLTRKKKAQGVSVS